MSILRAKIPTHSTISKTSKTRSTKALIDKSIITTKPIPTEKDKKFRAKSDFDYYIIGDIHADIFVLIRLLSNIIHSNYIVYNNIYNNYINDNNIDNKIDVNLQDLYDNLDNIVQHISDQLNRRHKYIILIGDAIDMNDYADTVRTLRDQYDRLQVHGRNFSSLNTTYVTNTFHDNNFNNTCAGLGIVNPKRDAILKYMQDLSYLTYLFILKLKKTATNHLIYILGNHDRLRGNRIGSTYTYLRSVNHTDGTANIVVNGINVDANCNQAFINILNNNNNILNNHINRDGLVTYLNTQLQYRTLNMDIVPPLEIPHRYDLYISHAGILFYTDRTGVNIEVYHDNLISLLSNYLRDGNIDNLNHTVLRLINDIDTGNVNNIFLPYQIIGHTLMYTTFIGPTIPRPIRNSFDIIHNILERSNNNDNRIILISDNLQTIYMNDNDRYFTSFYRILHYNNGDSILYRKTDDNPDPLPVDRNAISNINYDPGRGFVGGNEYKLSNNLINHFNNIKKFINQNINLIFLMSIINYDMFIYLLANIILIPNVTKKLLDVNIRNQQLIKLYLSLYPTSKEQLSNNKELKQFYGDMIEVYYNNEDLFNLENFVNFIIKNNNIELNKEENEMINELINELNNMKKEDLLKIFDN